MFTIFSLVGILLFVYLFGFMVAIKTGYSFKKAYLWFLNIPKSNIDYSEVPILLRPLFFIYIISIPIKDNEL